MRIFLFVVIGILVSVNTIDAQTIREIFINMPAALTPALTMVNKEDMLDFKDSNMKAVVTDSFDGNVEMTDLSESYLSVNTSSAGRLQLKLLPVNDSINVVCMVRTVCPDACLSNISFYSTKWEKLASADYFKFPALSEFLVDNTPELLDSISHTSMADIDLFEYTLSASDNTLTITSTIKDYVTKEEKEFLEDKLSADPVRMVWRNGKFELE